MEKILSSFPAVQFAFAYGSGVIEQTSSSPSSPAPSSLDTLIDLVFVVDDPLDWHTRNMALNPSHYTPIIPFSPPWVAFIQSKVGARVWYNVYISVPSIPSRLMKYGVISTSDLMRDLLSWKWLYIAGRLQKPVQILQSNLEIESAVQRNVEQALRVALLLMPRLFNEVDLFRGVASLSYIGDPRMLVGENPKKVRTCPARFPLPKLLFTDQVLFRL